MNINEFSDTLNELYDQLQEFQYDLVIGLSRGGLVPAVFISHKLGVPMVVADITHEQSRGDNIDSHSNIIPDIDTNVKSILVVDDIVDSGNTILALVTNLKTSAEVTVCSLFLKDGAADYLYHNLVIDRQYTNFLGCYAPIILNKDAPFVYFPWELQN